MSVLPADFAKKWRMIYPLPKGYDPYYHGFKKSGFVSFYDRPGGAVLIKRKWVGGCKAINPFIVFMLF